MRVESESNENSGDLKKLVEENLKLTRDLAFSIKKIRRYIFWLQLANLLKFVIIVVPLVLAVIYLQPVIKNLFKTYEELLGPTGTISELKQVQDGTANIQDLLKSPQVQDFLRKQQK